jgi:uncharacterized protein (DUF885 family)
MIRAGLLLVGSVLSAWALTGAERASAAPVAGSVRHALDAAAAVPPTEALALLRSIVGTTPGERLDLEVAREGLAVDAQLSRAPAGPARYALQVQRSSGTIDLAAARERIDREYRRLALRADRLFRSIGMRQGSVGERYRTLWSDPRSRYPDSDAGRDRAVTDMNRTLTEVQLKLARWFGPLPAAVLGVRTSRMIPADEAKRRAGYRELPGATSPGGYFVDLADIARRPNWSLPAVVRHELLPGHMIQLPAEARAEPHPLRLRYAAAFSEGWATYAEALAADDTDPRVALGNIHWLLFRLCRARVDFGMHLDGWSDARAMAELEACQGVSAYFAPFTVDVARIRAEPAIRVGDLLVWLAIADAAQGRRGARLIHLHEALVRNGRMRLDGIVRAGR